MGTVRIRGADAALDDAALDVDDVALAGSGNGGGGRLGEVTWLKVSLSIFTDLSVTLNFWFDCTIVFTFPSVNFCMDCKIKRIFL